MSAPTADRPDHTLGCLFVTFFLFPPSLALNTFVALKLWGWFVLPLGAPALGFWQMAGLFTFVRFMVFRSKDNPDTEINYTAVVVNLFLPGPVFLAVGYLTRGML